MRNSTIFDYVIWVNIFYFFYYFRRIIRVSPWTVLDMIRYFINLNSTSQGLHLFPRDKVSLGKDLTAMSCFWKRIMLNFIFWQLLGRIIKEWTISNNFFIPLQNVSTFYSIFGFANNFCRIKVFFCVPRTWDRKLKRDAIVY